MKKLTTKLVNKPNNYCLRRVLQIKYLTCLLLLLFSSKGLGQSASQYSFSSSSGASAETILSPTVLTSATSGSADDGFISITPSPSFQFNFAGTTYSTFNAGTNGYLIFGSSVPTSSTIPSSITSQSGYATVYCFGRDSNLNTTNGGNVTHGPAANGKYVIQITKNSGASSGGASSSVYATFQIVLWGTSSTNPGRIQVIYTNIAGTPASSGTVGIRDVSNNYLNGVNGLTNSSSVASSYPTSGTVYSYAPPTPCSGTPTPGNTITSVNPLAIGSSTILSLQNNTSGTGVTYQWKSSSDNVTYSSISGATNSTYTASPTINTYYVCDVICSGNTASSNPVLVNMITCYVPTALTSSSISYQTATIGWTTPATGTSPASYEYEVRTSGAAGSGASGLVTSGTTTAPTVSVILTGLNGGTAYTYYVRSNCGGGDFSSWSSAGTFTTTSCNVPTVVTSSAITTTTATVSWTAPASGSPTGYEYEIRTSGAAGSGATGLVTSGITTAPTVTTSLTGLTAATSYSVYVRTNCYSGFNSSWTSAVTFITLCNSVTSFPFTESFEGISSGIPTCWGLAGTLSAGSSYHFNSTSSGQTGRGLIFNSYSSTSGSTSELITPTLDLSTLTTAELKFYFKNPTGGNFEVLISTNNGSTYTSLQSSLTGQTAWLQKTYTITSYISSTVKIKFKGTSNYGNGDAYIYLDEITIQAIPTCYNPTILTSSAITYQTATITWTAPTSGTSPAGYEYEVRTSGAAGSGATGLVTSGSTTAPTASVNLTGLNGGTAHTYYVRSNCGGGDFSSWSSATFSTTSCNVPTAVTSSAITATTATVSWTAPATGSPAGYEYEVRSSGAAGSGATGLVASGTTTAPTVSASLTGLSASTSYSVYVRTNCYSGFNSSWTSVVTFTTLQIPASSPYVDDFSSNNYTLVNGSQTNKWVYGSVVGNTGSSLYISNDNGVTNGYSNSTTSVVHAYRDITISSGSTTSNFSFDWKSVGEVDYDYLRVWLVPSSFIPTSGTQIVSGSGKIQVGSNFQNNASWQTYANSALDISSFANTTMRLVFEWKNDGSGGSTPPVAIDNVRFIISNVWTGTTSSSWNTAANWSLNTVPTTADNIVISSNGTNAPVMDVDLTIPAGKSLTISGTGILTIAPGKVLTIAGTADFGGKAVTFKSDATGSGMFGPLTGTLTGATNVKVERYIPAKRAYRFVSSPVTTTTTIKQNWQENAGATAGLGTHITGAGGATNGFDATSTDNPSMYTFTGGAWAAVTNTNVNVLTAGTPYRLMVRGDRTTDLTTNTPTPTVTTLRATGTLKTGSFSPTINQTADGYSLIGNPYQAPIDIKAILTAASNMNAGVVYYWDPTLNTRGGYVTRDLTTDVNDVTSGFNQYVQPGQAVFVKRDNTANAASVTITESHKSVANGAAGVFRTTTPNDFGLLRVNLQANTNNQWQNIEGTLALFNDNFSWNVTPEDATKMSNLDEEVSFVQNNTSLAIACLSAPNANSELPIQMNNLRQSNYQWQFELANYQGERPYLYDAQNNTYTEITNGVVVPFTTTTAAANRFKIVFQPSALSTDDFANGLVVYPNPAKAGASFFVQGITAAQVTVYNVLGQNIPVQVKSQGNALQVTPTQTLSQGIYLITVTTEGKTQQVKWIVE